MPALIHETPTFTAPVVQKPSKAPKVVGSATKRATRPSNKLPQWLIDGARIPHEEKQTFIPTRHLIYEKPKKIYSMGEIGLEGQGISPNAVSVPFPLFTEEAIRQIRAECFSENVLENCQYESGFAKNMIRGMSHVRAPFIYDAWKSPELLAAVSEIAGVDLIPAWDWEIANINIAINEEGDKPTDKSNEGDNTSTFAWHYDSFPFVCVVMLSDCTEMIGGETALKTPSGEIMKVRGPTMGTAVVMQGRYIEHQVLKALGGKERISMVTPFRPKSPFVRDELLLTGVRGISDLSATYTQYSEYRLEVLEERMRAKLKDVRQREITGRPFDIPAMKSFLMEQKEFVESMMEEICEVEDD